MKKLYEVVTVADRLSEEPTAMVDGKLYIYPACTDPETGIKHTAEIAMESYCKKSITAMKKFSRAYNQALADGVIPEEIIYVIGKGEIEDNYFEGFEFDESSCDTCDNFIATWDDIQEGRADCYWNHECQVLDENLYYHYIVAKDCRRENKVEEVKEVKRPDRYQAKVYYRAYNGEEKCLWNWATDSLETAQKDLAALSKQVIWNCTEVIECNGEVIYKNEVTDRNTVENNNFTVETSEATSKLNGVKVTRKTFDIQKFAENKNYTYYLKGDRPINGGAPAGYVDSEKWTPAKRIPRAGHFYGYVTYSRELTENEIAGYDLVSKVEVDKKYQVYLDRMAKVQAEEKAAEKMKVEMVKIGANYSAGKVREVEDAKFNTLVTIVEKISGGQVDFINHFNFKAQEWLGVTAGENFLHCLVGDRNSYEKIMYFMAANNVVTVNDNGYRQAVIHIIYGDKEKYDFEEYKPQVEEVVRFEVGKTYKTATKANGEGWAAEILSRGEKVLRIDLKNEYTGTKRRKLGEAQVIQLENTKSEIFVTSLGNYSYEFYATDVVVEVQKTAEEKAVEELQSVIVHIDNGINFNKKMINEYPKLVADCYRQIIAYGKELAEKKLETARFEIEKATAQKKIANLVAAMIIDDGSNDNTDAEETFTPYYTFNPAWTDYELEDVPEVNFNLQNFAEKEIVKFEVGKTYTARNYFVTIEKRTEKQARIQVTYSDGYKGGIISSHKIEVREGVETLNLGQIYGYADVAATDILEDKDDAITAAMTYEIDQLKARIAELERQLEEKETEFNKHMEKVQTEEENKLHALSGKEIDVVTICGRQLTIQDFNEVYCDCFNASDGVCYKLRYGWKYNIALYKTAKEFKAAVNKLVEAVNRGDKEISFETH